MQRKLPIWKIRIIRQDGGQVHEQCFRIRCKEADLETGISVLITSLLLSLILVRTGWNQLEEAINICGRRTVDVHRLHWEQARRDKLFLSKFRQRWGKTPFVNADLKHGFITIEINTKLFWTRPISFLYLDMAHSASTIVFRPNENRKINRTSWQLHCWRVHFFVLIFLQSHKAVLEGIIARPKVTYEWTRTTTYDPFHSAQENSFGWWPYLCSRCIRFKVTVWLGIVCQQISLTSVALTASRKCWCCIHCHAANEACYCSLHPRRRLSHFT
jgi:hypothetical protein